MNTHGHMVVRALLILLLAGTTACQSPAPRTSSLTTVPVVDLDRYSGRWYEIAKIPNRFQRQRNQRHHATLDMHEGMGGSPGSTRRRTCGDQFDEAHVMARVADRHTNAKLEVSFFSLLGWDWYGRLTGCWCLADA